MQKRENSAQYIIYEEKKLTKPKHLSKTLVESESFQLEHGNLNGELLRNVENS